MESADAIWAGYLYGIKPFPELHSELGKLGSRSVTIAQLRSVSAEIRRI